MPGTVKIWWHDGAVRDVRYHDIPVVNEPELGFESIAVGASPVQSGAGPGGCRGRDRRKRRECALSRPQKRGRRGR